MRNDSVKRLASFTRRKFAITLALMAPLAVLAFASTALATPKGIFSVFAQCPVKEAGATLCTFSQITGGEVKLGTTSVPINKTITLQGGAIPTGNEENEREYFLTPAKNGESLSKTELNVPGGLLGLVNCEEITGIGFPEKDLRAKCKFYFENFITGVTATTELVANASNPPILNLVALATEEETALTLPIRVHLNNPLLGSSCYIGSEAFPIQLHLTTGATSPNKPNKSIHGTRGLISNQEEKGQTLLKVTGTSLVDNAFSAPLASGCGAFGLLDPILDFKIGLPSLNGHNTAILNGNLQTATTEAVLASEKF
jgi:hypothetical protein